MHSVIVAICSRTVASPLYAQRLRICCPKGSWRILHVTTIAKQTVLTDSIRHYDCMSVRIIWIGHMSKNYVDFMVRDPIAIIELGQGLICNFKNLNRCLNVKI
jgi:hypothetical protein